VPSLQAQLEQARNYVEETQKRIHDQLALIDRLKSDRHDTEAAERLLATFIDLMSKLTMHRNNLKRAAEERARNPGDAAREGLER
jgi:DNA repair exonuclease SbcCD ATPase subunit